jgi:transposase
MPASRPKKKFQRYDPDQILLIAPNLHEWLPKDHLCYFVADTVDGLDLSLFYARYEEPRGSPPYDPKMMVLVLIYAYSIGMTSSRQIFQALQENIAFRVLAADNRPDHRTICRFRTLHAEALQGLFLQVLDMCKRANMVPAKAVALDGTKVKANASMAKNRTKEQLDKELRDYVEKVFAEAERKDKEEDELYGEENDGFSLPAHLRDRKARKEFIREGLRQIKEEEEKKKAEEEKKLADRKEKEKEEAAKGKEVRGRKPVQKEAKPARRNTTDPDSRTMKTWNGYVQGYNVQIAVDCSSQVIVACDVVQDGNDKHQLARMFSQVRENLGRLPEKLLADAGYFSTKEIDSIDGTELFVATKSRKKAGIEEFLPIIELGGRPTTKQAMELRLGTNEGRAVYRQRGQTVEPVNGQLKDRGGMREFKLRGLEGTMLEALLICLGHNIKKMRGWSKNVNSNRNEDRTATGLRAAASMISSGAGGSGHPIVPGSC